MTLGHVALRVRDVARSQAFYARRFGMRPAWIPDADNVYLTCGTDVLALHRDPEVRPDPDHGPLDHLGFLAGSPEEVDRIAADAARDGDPVVRPPRRHRDGSYSCYLADPDGNLVQVVHVAADVGGRSVPAAPGGSSRGASSRARRKMRRKMGTATYYGKWGQPPV